MENKDIILIANSAISLINDIRKQLKKINRCHDDMNYLILTELYSLRTQAYILLHEQHFFQLDKEILELDIIEKFNQIKTKVLEIKDLFLLKRMVFLVSMLVSSIGVGESEIVLNLLDKINLL